MIVAFTEVLPSMSLGGEVESLSRLSKSTVLWHNGQVELPYL